ncbi:MAG: RNA polymerase sigma factor [Acidobacteriota bacterium]
MTRTALQSIVDLAPPPVELKGAAIPDQEDPLGRGSGANDLARLRTRLEAAVRAVCPGWLRDQQQDIVQVAMMAVLRQREKQPHRSQFPGSYLRRAAYTAMIDEMRRRRSRGEVPLETAEGESSLVARGGSPEHLVSAGQIADGVRDCLQHLAPPRRAAVTLHLLGYRVPQIAERMGWKPKRAENLVYRGMDDLRQCLREKGLEP